MNQRHRETIVGNDGDLLVGRTHERSQSSSWNAEQGKQGSSQWIIVEISECSGVLKGVKNIWNQHNGYSHG